MSQFCKAQFVSSMPIKFTSSTFSIFCRHSAGWMSRVFDRLFVRVKASWMSYFHSNGFFILLVPFLLKIGDFCTDSWVDFNDEKNRQLHIILAIIISVFSACVIILVAYMVIFPATYTEVESRQTGQPQQIIRKQSKVEDSKVCHRTLINFLFLTKTAFEASSNVSD